MRNNEHVEDGLFQHRRVDDPALENRPRKEGDALHTRSVSLSSEALGLSGKLDLIEQKAGATYPIEYKRSAAPKDDAGRPTCWDNDAVQLCGQALLLEESLNTPIDRGVLYYIGSRERVDVPIDEALRAKTRAAIATIRELSSRPAPPEPLPAELRHRCPGCSLLTVCQPEETLYEIKKAAVPEAPPPAGLTRVLPQGDDGAVVYLQEPGAHVGRRSC